MRILIYGGGSVGLGLASFLEADGAAVSVIARPPAADLINREGVLRTGILGDRHSPAGSVPAFAGLAAIPSGAPPPDYILVCVKSFDSQAAAADLAENPSIMRPSTRLVLFQNGWGNRDVFAEAIPGRPIYTARVITGFRRPAPNHTDITVHADAVRIGSLEAVPSNDVLAALAPLCEAISRGGYPCEPSPEVGRHIWAKILYNCALNPLGAILKVPYGTLAEHEPTRALMNGIFDEIFAVMAADGQQTLWPDAASYREAFYGRLVPTTAAHRSSTLQDLEAGRRTEIDALSGAIVSLGRRHGIPTPVNETMLRIIKGLEALRS